MLPNQPTTLKKILPSYLYFQYQDDLDLQALVDAYNKEAQVYVDWFLNNHLPIYPGLSGQLLDMVGKGLYGFPRPDLTAITILPFLGATSSYESAEYETAYGEVRHAEKELGTPDDIYKRMLTWRFYKGDGFLFTIPWLKRRIYRFLYGNNGSDVEIGFTPKVSVVFLNFQPYGQPVFMGALASYQTAYVATASGVIRNIPIPPKRAQTIVIVIKDTDIEMIEYFKAGINCGAISFPFRFSVVVNPQGVGYV